MQPAGCYFSKISDFLEIVSKSSEARYKNRSSVNKEFNTEMFVSQTVRPVFEALIDEIQIAFDIPEQMKGFASIDPVMIPQKSKNLKEFGIDGINAWLCFMVKQQPSQVNWFQKLFVQMLYAFSTKLTSSSF